jgi:hypothetical protein
LEGAGAGCGATEDELLNQDNMGDEDEDDASDVCQNFE